MKLQGLLCLINNHNWSRPWYEGARRVELTRIGRRVRTIKLCAHLGGYKVTVERWKSFGWEVIEDDGKKRPGGV